MKMRILVAVLMIVALLGAAAITIFTPTPTPIPTPTAAAPVTTGTATSTAPTSTTGITSTSSAAKITGMTIITQADNGSTIRLHKNEQFLIQLDNGIKWTLSFAPTGAVPGIITQVGSRDVYEAVKAGNVALNATGAPICKPDAACPQFLVSVTVAFVIN